MQHLGEGRSTPPTSSSSTEIRAERFQFSETEGLVALQAVAYLTNSRLQTRAARWNSWAEQDGQLADPPGRLAIGQLMMSNLTDIQLGSSLTKKASESIADSDTTVNLTSFELQMLGAALFNYGNTIVPELIRKIENGATSFESAEQREEAKEQFTDRTDQAQTLYEALQPIGKDMHLSWRGWGAEEPIHIV